MTEIKERSKNLGKTAAGEDEESAMPPPQESVEPAAEAERIPFMQRVLDDPFLLLFVGVTMPTVFYLLWGVMEVASVPLGK